jgi:AAHS family 4-hydroxybenzoate transporter-like MFS transporter
MGAPGIVTVLYLLASVFIFGIGLAGANVPLLMVTILSCGICVVGGQGFINVLSAILYPTSVRSTGVGWALGIGRIGAVIGPVIAGLLLARHITSQHLFFMIAAPSLVASLSMFLLGLRLRRAEAISTVNPAVTAG